ncbi:MAG: D-alanyl-D-alanine carboxypeptidase family protein [Streptococcaceae bacterium]|jgi:LAS superfamily LD-carboxypeptidase LdcB|nr:D-alanyl-D-alanine carboxypeptidase family protein [Streptococcaceae bacterium]
MKELSKKSLVPFDQEKYEAAAYKDPLLVACNYSFSLPEVKFDDLEELENQGKPVLLHKWMIPEIKKLFLAAVNFNANFQKACKISSGYRTIEQLEQLRKDRYFLKLLEMYLEKQEENDPVKMFQKSMKKMSEQERLIKYFGLRKSPELIELEKKYANDSEKFLAAVDPSIKEWLKQEALKKVDQSVPYAGRSDHHTGFAVDLPHTIVNVEFYQWLEENAYHYGFIRRYTEESREYTRVDPEIWHWRYVGQNHAEQIHKLGVTLDEYVIKKHYEDVL